MINDAANHNISSRKTNKERIEYIDIFRAFGIIMMIMGHTGFGSVFYKWIHCFHMPMFFVISGYFYKDISFSKFVCRRAKTLLLPYIVFGLLHCIIYFLVNGFDKEVLYSLFWENTNGNMPIAGALWFLTAMFISELIFWLVQHSTKSVLFSTLISATVAVFGMALPTFFSIRLPYAFDVGMVGVGFFQIGKLIKDKFNKTIELNLLNTIIGIILFSVIGLLNDYVNLKNGWYGIWPLFWISSTGLTLSFWNLSRIIYSRLTDKKRLNSVILWLQGIGCNSIIYLCLNQLMIFVNRSVFDLFVPITNNMVLLGRNVIIFPLTLVELLILQKLITNTKLKVIVGKW